MGQARKGVGSACRAVHLAVIVPAIVAVGPTHSYWKGAVKGAQSAVLDEVRPLSAAADGGASLRLHPCCLAGLLSNLAAGLRTANPPTGSPGPTEWRQSGEMQPLVLRTGIGQQRIKTPLNTAGVPQL